MTRFTFWTLANFVLAVVFLGMGYEKITVCTQLVIAIIWWVGGEVVRAVRQ